VPTQCSREVEIVSPIDAPLLIVSTGWLPWRKHHVEAPALGDWAEYLDPAPDSSELDRELGDGSLLIGCPFRQHT
jgi:hypothetical protein